MCQYFLLFQSCTCRQLELTAIWVCWQVQLLGWVCWHPIHAGFQEQAGLHLARQEVSSLSFVHPAVTSVVKVKLQQLRSAMTRLQVFTILAFGSTYLIIISLRINCSQNKRGKESCVASKERHFCIELICQVSQWLSLFPFYFSMTMSWLWKMTPRWHRNLHRGVCVGGWGVRRDVTLTNT